jgi:TPR repeat protein
MKVRDNRMPASCVARLTLLIFVMLLISITSSTAVAGYEEGKMAAEAGDYETAYQEWLPLGEKGHSRAQYQLGRLFEDGKGVPNDAGSAAIWYERAAELGHARAQYRLARLYETGKGVLEDATAAPSTGLG